MESRRHGYTMMEIILVLAVLIIVSALAMPSLLGMLRSSNLEAAADTVRSELTRARNKAQEERRPYKFAVRVNTGTYRIAPDGDEFWGGNGGSGSSRDKDGGGLENTVTQGNLPEKICFAQPGGASNINGGSDWSTVATFQPDGSALDDVEVGLSVNGGASSMVIRLKAATGSISTASLATVGNLR